MKKSIKGFVTGVITTVLLLSLIGTAFAAVSQQSITAYFNNIKLVVDGKTVTPKDALGNVVEPFIYNGTTYLPVRAVGEAVGKTVYWDGKTNTVYLGAVDGNTPVENLTNLTVFEGKELKMVSTGYTDNTGTLRIPAVRVYNNSPSTYLLNMKYSTLKGNVALGEGSKNTTREGYLKIYGDDKLLYTSDVITSGSLPQDFAVDISGVVKLKIETAFSGFSDDSRLAILSGLDLYN